MDPKTLGGGPPRERDEEAAKLIAQIETLRMLFPENTKKSVSDEDGTDGMLYLCRYTSFTEEEDPLESKKKVQKKRSKNNSSTSVDSYMDEEEEYVEEGKENIGGDRKEMSAQSREKKRQFAISLVTLAMDPERRCKLIEDGAIEMLMELSGVDDGYIKRSCAAAFSYLAGEPKVRSRMINEGCVGSLFTLANAFSETIQSDVARALCNLLHSEGCEARAIRDGASIIVSHIAKDSQTAEVVDICLYVLLNLSCVPDRFPKVEEINDAILSINYLPLTEKQDEIVLSVLCNLSALRGNQFRIVEDGLIKIVERVMSSSSPHIRTLAAEVIVNLTSDPKSRSKILEHNTLGILKNMSRDSSEFVRTCCIQCYFNLSRDLVSREKMVAAHSVPVIIKISLDKISISMAKVSSKTLKSLCSDLSITNYLVKEGIMKAFNSLVEVDDDATRQFVAEGLCTLFQSKKEVLKKLIEQGAVGLIVQLSSSSDNPTTGEWCSYALLHLASSNLCPPTMVAQGILPCLIALCEDHSTDLARRFCSTAFSHITIQKDVDSDIAIPTLVHMLRYSIDHITKSECAASLYNLADSDMSCDKMLEAGALMPIVKLTQSDFMSTKIKCAAILSRLSLHSQYYGEFSKDPTVLETLLGLSQVDHTLTQRRVVIALSNLSQNAELRKMLLTVDDTPNVMKVLCSKPDENLRRGCAAIICNLAYENDSGVEMVKSGIVPTLLVTALVTSDQIESKLICVKALLNIMEDPNLHEAMVKDDVIWGLSTLSRDEIIKIDNGREESLRKIREEKMTAINAQRVMETKARMIDEDGGSVGAESLGTIASVTMTEMLDIIPAFSEEDDAQIRRLYAHNYEVLTLGTRALCCLSTRFAKEMLSSGSLLSIVVRLISMQDPQDAELMKLGGITLTNILLVSTNENEAFRLKAVSCMENLVACKDAEVSEMCVLCLCFASQSESCRAKIVQLTKNMDSSKIFSEPRVSYAYLAMFENIANNPEMRSQLLDEHLVQRFAQVIKSNDQQLNLAVAKALYCISCDNLNVMKLTDQNVLPVFLILWHTEIANPTEKLQDLLHHIIAVLYNLCCNEACAPKLVQQGICKVFSEVWEHARKEFKYAELIYLAVTQLATHNVNTVKMVEDGCVEILCSLRHCANGELSVQAGEKKKNSLLKPSDVKSISQKHYFREPVLNRLAAALRNLLCIFASHDALVDGGCIETLVIIANLRALPVAKENASVALRSLTFNTALQQKLVDSGAIKIMLEEIKRSMKGESLPLNDSLLSTLESESWRNGSRGALKEGRADFKEPIEFFLDLMKGSTHIRANFDPKVATLEKYLVQIQLVEPPIEIESKGEEALGLSELSNFKEEADYTDVTPMTKPKVECPINDHKIYTLKRAIIDPTTEDDDASIGSDPQINAGGMDDVEYSPNAIKPDKAEKLPEMIMINSNSSVSGGSVGKSRGKRGMKGSQSAGMLPKINAPKRPDPVEKFNELLSTIVRSKASNGALIEDVSKQWNSFSQF